VPVDQGTNTPYLDMPFQQFLSSYPNVTTQHIDIRIQLTQVRLSDITIKLVSNSGEVSTLLSRPATATDISGNTVNTTSLADYDFTFDTVKDWGEGLQDYHLVISYAAGTTPAGQISGVSTDIYGDTFDTTIPYFYTDEFGQLGSNSARSTLSSPGNNVVLDAAAVS